VPSHIRLLQRGLACCSVLQCVAVCCSGIAGTNVTGCLSYATASHHIVSALSSEMQCVVLCCSELQCVAVCCSVLQCVTVCCIALQCVAVRCSVLQYFL